MVSHGQRTHNHMAEYGAIVAALRGVLAAGPRPIAEIEVWCDCQYVVDRLNGRLGTGRPRGVVMLHETALRYARQLRRKGGRLHFLQVDRKWVQTAHLLCRLVYDAGLALPATGRKPGRCNGSARLPGRLASRPPGSTPAP